MNLIEFVGYLASALVFATFCMKTMIPLRMAAICSNLAFIIYGFYDHVYPVLILHVILLPLNVIRTAQLTYFVRRVEKASKGDLSVDWLKPFMKHAQRKAGEMLFCRGDTADCLYMVISGELLLVEIDHVARAGDFLGEVALFSADHRRTQTARAITDIELLWIGEKELAQVFYQNPEISFYFLRLITSRLVANAARFESLALRSAASVQEVLNA
jgi:CRP/FNR family transcriptional regulator, cyclic AMP receptor protein